MILIRNFSKLFHLRLLLGITFYFFNSYSSGAQNLVPNPSFEEYSFCPFVADDDGLMPCPPWVSLYSANYFNACAPFPSGVPLNFKGFQYAHTGDGYVGGYQFPNGREFVQAPLLEPLVPGQCYEVSFYACLSDHACGINHLGALFTEFSDPPFVGMTPQLDATMEYFSDSVNWFQLSGKFIATGLEAYITIGNFAVSSEVQYDPNCAIVNSAYYYFDDVVVEAVETFPIDVDLGGPYIDCYSVTLDAGITGVEYHWSDGSTDPTLLVTTSGTYYLVVEGDECHGGVSYVDVTILDLPAVDLGPDVTICDGDSITVHLHDQGGNYTWSTGENVSEITISSPGIYSVTFEDGCDISYDQIEVTTVQLPVNPLGDDFLLCPGETFEFNFNDQLADYLWQDHSTSGSHTIDEPGTYLLTITNACGTTSDILEVTSIDPPEIDLNPDTVLLCEGDSIVLSFDGSIGNFIWQDGSMNPGYTIHEAGDYSVNVTNACGDDSDHLYVQQISAPAVYLGIDLELCPGETVVLDGGLHYGDYQWQDGSTLQEFDVASPGIYALSVSNVCGSSSDAIIVEYAPDIQPPDLGPDVILCTGEQVLLDPGLQGGHIEWSDMSTGDTLLVTGSGVYHVNVSTYCESYTDTIMVTLLDIALEVNLPEDFSLCQGSTVTLETGIGNGSFLWNDGTQLSQLTVNSPGNYSVTVTTSCGTSMDSVVITDGGLAPQVYLGSDTVMCEGESVILAPAFSNVTSWAWMDGSTEPEFVATTPGIVFIQAFNDCGASFDTILVDLIPGVPGFSLGNDTTLCHGETLTLEPDLPEGAILWHDGSSGPGITLSDSATVIATISNICNTVSDTMNVFLSGIPVLDLGDDLSICPGDEIVIAPEITGVDYLWNNGTTGNALLISQSGTIILTISNDCGSVADTIEIIETTDPPQLNLGPDQAACEGEDVILDPDISGVSYLWQDGSTDDHFIVTGSGEYILMVMNSCGSDKDTIAVEINGSAPSISFGPDTSLCEGGSMLLTVDSLPDTFNEWQDGSSEFQFNVVLPGLYYLTQSNDCGEDRDSIFIDFNKHPPVATLGNDTILCEGTSIQLQADADPFTTTMWQDGSANHIYVVTVPGIYILSETNNCGESLDSIVIDFLGPPPAFDLGPDTVVCPGESIVLQSPDFSLASLWQDGSMLGWYEVEHAGMYTLQLSNLCGISSDSIMVLFEDQIALLDLEDRYDWCEGDSILLDATQSFPAEYHWSSGDATPMLLVTEPGQYTVQVFAPCNVASHETIIEKSGDCLPIPAFYFPNVFSPNGDNINDQFTFSVGQEVEIVSASAMIYDRWGNQVFSANAFPFAWDGDFEDKLLMPGVYVYVVKISYKARGQIQHVSYSGDVTLIR